jgi:prepilin-type processing-associated H-X9-DG protein
LPVLSRAKAAARSARCKSNLHQVALAFTMYLQENSDKYPAERVANWKVGAWTSALLPSLSQGGDVFFCPTRQSTTSRVGVSAQLGPSWSGVPYDYNSQGTGKRNSRSRLGLAWSDVGAAIINEVREAQVTVPSDMIALSEPSGADPHIILSSFGLVSSWTTSVSTNWTGAVHNGSGNGLFCDGHVESQKQARWQEPTDRVRWRWNIDNEPHRETW